MAGLSITATPVGGGKSFNIANGSNARGPGGRMAVDVSGGSLFEVTVDAVYQDSLPLGASTPAFFDRRLESGAIPCVVEYEFTSGGEAFAFLRDLRRNCPRLAVVTLNFGGTAWTLPVAKLRPFRAALVGEVVVRVAYPLVFNFGTDLTPV